MLAIIAIHRLKAIQAHGGLPRWRSGKESASYCRRCRFSSWIGKTPWRRKWHPTPVFLPGKFHGQRSLAGYSPWGCKSQTRLSDWTTTYIYFAVPHSLWNLSYLTKDWTWALHSESMQSWPLGYQFPSMHFFFFLAALCSMWDFSSLIRVLTWVLYIGSMKS